ncbi:MAG TPA: FtsX-like permease family protein [Blastocatellia bacterium]|nr:FtsX-like permease family protein [Blastocatellia bacterium]
MWRTLLFISLRDWRNHHLRALITIIGVAIGVSTYFALRTVNQSLLASLAATVDKLAGKATLQITAGNSGFPDTVLATVRATPGVTGVTSQIQQFCRADLNDNAWLLILGIDPESEAQLRGYDLGGMAVPSGTPLSFGNPLAFLKLPNTIVLCSAFAEQQGLHAGDHLPVITSQGRVELTILYVLRDERIGSLYGGRVGIMDIHTAQKAFARGPNIDRLDLMTGDGDDVETVRQRLKERLAAGLDIERPQQRSQQVEDATVMVRRGFLMTSLIALLISSFLIFNAMAIAVNQRWKEIGILRAIGVERRRVRRMFLYDASLIGLIGSAAGVIAGYLIALGFSRLAGQLAHVLSVSMPSSLLPMIAAPEPPRFHAGYAGEAIALGMLASLISAWLPARAAARLNPILALHNIETRQRERVIGWPRLALGATLVMAGLALVCLTTPTIGVILQLSYFLLIFFGLILMLPRLAAWMAMALRPLANRAFGSEGILAVDSIILAPRRTSATVAALMVGLAFVFSLWAFIQSEKAVLLNSFERRVDGDLQAWSTSAMTEDLAAQIAALHGIRDVRRSLFSTTRYSDRMVTLIASDMAFWFADANNSLVTGDLQQARELVPKGEGVLVSDIFAARSGLGVGDLLILETPTARLERPVLGVIDSKATAWLEGTVYLDRQLYKMYWQDSRVHWLAIDLEADADPTVVKGEIERATAGGPPLFVETATEIKRQGKATVASNIDQFFRFMYVQMFIVTFVAVIGMINTLVISVWERQREIGIIRAVGGTRRQVRKMVLLEAAAISLIGLVAGAMKGGFDAYFMSRTAAVIFGGYSVPFTFPGLLVLVSLPVLLAIALIAAWWPARLAANTRVVAVIGSE